MHTRRKEAKGTSINDVRAEGGGAGKEMGKFADNHYFVDTRGGGQKSQNHVDVIYGSSQRPFVLSVVRLAAAALEQMIYGLLLFRKGECGGEGEDTKRK